MTNRQIFGHFDQAYVINMDKDRDRLRRFKTRAAGIGLTDVIRVRGVHANPSKRMFTQRGKHGLCALSHVRAWQAMLANGHRHAVVFEDDVVFRDDAGTLLKERIIPQLATLEHTIPWDMFYLGWSIAEQNVGNIVSPEIAVANAAGHCHAYAVSAAGARKLIPFVKQFIYQPQDGLLTHTFWDQLPLAGLVRLFARTMLAIQEPGYSNTADGDVDRVSWYFRNNLANRIEFAAHCGEMRSWKQ